MPIPWLTRPPTAEEVAAHAKAYPVGPPDLGRGLWLRLPEQPVAWKRAGDLRELFVIGDRHIGGDWHQGDTATAFADWDDEPRDEVRKVRNLLVALGKL